MRARGGGTGGTISLAGRSSRSLCGVALALAALLPFAIATHLASEFVALGVERDVPVAFGTHHLYLVALALASLATIVAIVREAILRRGRRAVEALIAILPWHGTGGAFAAFCLALQATFFFVTQWIEGAPIRAGDVVLGTLVAAATALLSTLAIARLKRVALRFAVRLCSVWFVARRSTVVAALRRAPRSPRTPRRRWAVLASRACRPPPRSHVAA